MTGNSTRKGMAVLVGGKLFEKILGFFALVLYARFFSPVELALVPLLFLLANFSLVLFGFGIMPTIVMEVPRLLINQHGKAVSLIKHALWIGVAGGVCSALLIVLFAEHARSILPPMGQGAVLWLAMGVALQALFALLTQLLAGMSRFMQLSVASALVSIVRLILVIPLYQAYGTAGIAAGLTVAAGMGCLLLLWQLRDVLFCRETGKYGYAEILKLSWPFYLESYLMYFRSQGDQLVVTGMLGAEALAQYYLARRLYDLLKVLADSVDSTLIPALSRLSLERGTVFADKWHSLYRIGLTFSIPASLISAALVPLYLAILGGDKYRGALVPAIILCMMFVVDIMRVVVNRSVFVLCPPVKRLQITMLEAAILLPLLVVGAYYLGAAGAALATLISSVAAVYFAYSMLQRVLPIKVEMREWATIMLPAIVSFVLMAVVIAGVAGDMHAGAIRFGVSTLLGITVFIMIYINLVSIELLEILTESLGGGRWGTLGHLLTKFRIKRR